MKLEFNYFDVWVSQPIIWQYYNEKGEGYGDVIFGYSIIYHPETHIYELYSKNNLQITVCTSFDDAKKTAQEHFNCFIKSIKHDTTTSN